MSGCGFSTPCPNCHKLANANNDSKPFEQTSMECLHCGFITSTYADYMTLEDLNEMRVDQGMRPLKQLPKQDPDLKI